MEFFKIKSAVEFLKRSLSSLPLTINVDKTELLLFASYACNLLDFNVVISNNNTVFLFYQ